MVLELAQSATIERLASSAYLQNGLVPEEPLQQVFASRCAHCLEVLQHKAVMLL